MIRKFIQCKNTKERLNLMESTQIQDWTEGQLDTVMEISGIKMSAGASKEDKWQMILLALANKEVIAEREMEKEAKVFADDKEQVDLTEDLERASDLKAYIEVCKKEDKITE